MNNSRDQIKVKKTYLNLNTDTELEQRAIHKFMIYIDFKKNAKNTGQKVNDFIADLLC